MNEVANANAEELRETMGPLDDIGGLGPMSRMCLLVAIIRNQSETLLLHTCVSWLVQGAYFQLMNLHHTFAFFGGALLTDLWDSHLMGN